MSSGVKGFVSEKQLEEKRQTRQAEWERVRKPEDPVQAPEEQYDPRSLYERLKEQQDKKQEEFEEQLKFKNQFRGINQEESEFLDDVGKKTLELEKQKRMEERRELEEFRTAQAQSRELPEVGLDLPVEKEDKSTSKKVQIVRKNHQQNILKTAVKRKATSSEVEKVAKEVEQNAINAVKAPKVEEQKQAVVLPAATRCVGILPGLSAYDQDDSDEDSDSSSDESGGVSNNLLSSIVHNNSQCS